MTFVHHEPTWFLAQLKPNCAQIAQKNLSRQGFRTFLPMEQETRQRGGKFVTVSRPLFPGYLFVAFDIAKGLWRSVNATHGVTRLVSFGTKPASVPQELVSRLMERYDRSSELQSPPHIQPGDQVVLTTGPFANVVAQIEKVAPDQRAWVLIETMGRQTRVAVGTAQLRAV